MVNKNLIALYEHFYNIFPNHGSNCSYGFKEYDKIDGKIVVEKVKKDTFFYKSEMYKAVQLNTRNLFSTISFDMDMPYDEYKSYLTKLVQDDIIPEPTYIIVRNSNKHFHIVYILDKVYKRSFISNHDKLKKIRAVFTEIFQSDKGYKNIYIHNPFYKYSIETQEYYTDDEHSFYLDQITEGTQFAFHDLNILNDYASQIKTNKYLANLIDKHITDDYEFFKKYLEIKKDKSGRYKILQDNVYAQRIPTGPNYRNNTLFLRSLYYLKTKQATTIEYLLEMIKEDYSYYETNYPYRPKMSLFELNCIAHSSIYIHKNGRNLIKSLRNLEGTDNSPEFFKYIQSERGKKSANLRIQHRELRIKQIEAELLKPKYLHEPDWILIYDFATKFNCSERTIRQDLSIIRQRQESLTKLNKTIAKQIDNSSFSYTPNSIIVNQANEKENQFILDSMSKKCNSNENELFEQFKNHFNIKIDKFQNDIATKQLWRNFVTFVIQQKFEWYKQKDCLKKQAERIENISFIQKLKLFVRTEKIEHPLLC